MRLRVISTSIMLTVILKKNYIELIFTPKYFYIFYRKNPLILRFKLINSVKKPLVLRITLILICAQHFTFVNRN